MDFNRTVENELESGPVRNCCEAELLLFYCCKESGTNKQGRVRSVVFIIIDFNC